MAKKVVVVNKGVRANRVCGWSWADSDSDNVDDFWEWADSCSDKSSCTAEVISKPSNPLSFYEGFYADASVRQAMAADGPADSPSAAALPCTKVTPDPVDSIIHQVLEELETPLANPHDAKAIQRLTSKAEAKMKRLLHSRIQQILAKHTSIK